MARDIDYGKLMHDAMRGLIQRVLEDVRDHGLPGAHHFFVTFDTTHRDARLAGWLRDRYPSEMTVVMQHWFEDLEVDANGFGVTLNFGDAPERLYIPFDAIKTFIDPSVEFGLRFEGRDDTEQDRRPGAAAPAADADTDAQAHTRKGRDAESREAEIVSLDTFRK
ncbi:MAG: ClpXP protease specificity-enhancing factor SspB [Roseovarius sp.]